MHQICYRDFPENVNRKLLIAEITEEAERYGDGTYSGPLRFHDEISPLESREAAEQRIQKLDNGWYDDHAVRYYDFADAKETKRMTEIRERIKETKRKRLEYEKEHSVQNFKAEFVGCPACGSKIARKYLRADYCLVCRADLRSETTKKTLQRYTEKIRELEQALEGERRKQQSSRKVMWLVKYEYHC